MKLSSIERNPDTKQLEVVFSFNDNLTLAIPIVEVRKAVPMIVSAAESLGVSHDDIDFIVSKFKGMCEELEMYSRYRTNIIRKHRICSAQYNDIFFTLACGGILTMNEIYWFDWYIKKNKLTGDING